MHFNSEDSNHSFLPEINIYRKNTQLLPLLTVCMYILISFKHKLSHVHEYSDIYFQKYFCLKEKNQRFATV